MPFLKRYICFVVVLILLSLSICNSRSNMSAKIVGGNYIKIRHYPHSVFLECICDYGATWSCGASVLNQKIILTAAHCLVDCNLKARRNAINAFAGSEDYLSKTSIKRVLGQSIIHEYYDEDSVANDIALGELVRFFPLNENIKRIILPRRFPNEKNGIVAGWGIVDEGSERQESKLKYIAQQLQPRWVCSKINGMAPGMFCARNMKTKWEYPSLGDSGSGLVTTRGEQLGLVSFRTQKAKELLVYTNVTFYLNWISAKARRMVCRY